MDENISEISENAIYEKNNFQEPFPVNQLDSKFCVSRQTVYNWFKALHVEPFTDKGKSYVTGEQVQLLDDYVKSGKSKTFIQECIDSGRIVVETASENSIASEPTAELSIIPSQGQEIVTQQSQELTATETTEISAESSRPNLVAELQQRKAAETQASDIQEVNERARDRAFAKAVAEESLMLIYEATENFTPEQSRQLEQHRGLCEQARKGRAVNVNDFLSQALVMSGLPNFSSSQQPSSSGVSANA